MKKASKIVSVTLAAALGLSVAAYAGVTNRTEAVAEADPVVADADELGGYLFVTFIGDGSGGSSAPIEQEQIYFALSRDAYVWSKVNDAKPVLYATGAKGADNSSVSGEGGVRDPSIIRKHDGSGFYIVATDLSVQSWNSDWGALQSKGSHRLTIWESDGDSLTEWKEPWLTPEIAPEGAGCTWAPEAIWDATREQYMVFWASPVGGGRHRIYRSFTEDFRTFTPAEIYMDEGGGADDKADEGRKWIDATIIEDNGVFYRFTKHEGTSKIYMEKSNSLDGPFVMVDTYTLDGTPCYNYSVAYEGPTAFKLNGQDKWCLFLDNFGGEGYVPFFTDDLASGKFTKSTDVLMDGVYRHGSIIPITNAEYAAIAEKWHFVSDTTEGELVYSLDFDANGIKTGADKATVNGTVTYEEHDGDYVAVINGRGNFIKLDAGFLAGLESMTISFDVNVVHGNSWLFFAAANEDNIVWGSTDSNYLGLLWGDNFEGIRIQRFLQFSNANRPEQAGKALALNQWVHVTAVIHLYSSELYFDGVMVDKAASGIRLSSILGENPIAYLGKATWGGGEYSDYKIGNVKIYNYAQSSSEVTAAYSAAKA